MTHTDDLLRLKNARIKALEGEVERLEKKVEFYGAQLEVIENGKEHI
jgi:hypothetical protein